MPPTEPDDPGNLDDAPTLLALRAGQRLFGRFVLERRLGRGGMGVVWLARDGSLDQHIALKLLPEALAGDEDAVEDLARETRKARSLAHPHIVRVYDFHRDERLAAISMEWIDGATLTGLRRQQPGQVFEPAQLAPWLPQLAEALDYAHRRAKVIHRDLKPANLMVTQEGELKVADFGISASVSESVTRVTRVASSSGSPPYMSPQQMFGERPSPADDVYALGATFYELLTGKPPFFAGNIAMQVQSKIPPSIADRRSELGVAGDAIAPQWEETIAACLSKQPENRPGSVADLVARLAAPAASKPAPADVVVDAPIRVAAPTLVGSTTPARSPAWEADPPRATGLSPAPSSLAPPRAPAESAKPSAVVSAVPAPATPPPLESRDLRGPWRWIVLAGLAATGAIAESTRTLSLDAAMWISDDPIQLSRVSLATFVVAIFVAGTLADRVRRMRLVLALVVAIWGVVVFGAAASKDADYFLVIRCLAVAFQAGWIGLGFVLLRRLFPGALLPLACGISALGGVIGTMLWPREPTDDFWRTGFAASGLIGVLLAAMWWFVFGRRGDRTLAAQTAAAEAEIAGAGDRRPRYARPAFWAVATLAALLFSVSDVVQTGWHHATTYDGGGQPNPVAVLTGQTIGLLLGGGLAAALVALRLLGPTAASRAVLLAACGLAAVLVVPGAAGVAWYRLQFPAWLFGCASAAWIACLTALMLNSHPRRPALAAALITLVGLAAQSGSAAAFVDLYPISQYYQIGGGLLLAATLTAAFLIRPAWFADAGVKPNRV